MRTRLVAALFAMSAQCLAETRIPDTLASADVQAKLDLSIAGDVVAMPAGSASWSVGVTVPASVTLQGAGIDATTITATMTGSGYSVNNRAIFIDDNVVLRDFTLASADATDDDDPGTTTCPEVLIVVPNATGFRITNMRIDNVVRRGIQTQGGIEASYGLIDNCILNARSYADPAKGLFQLITINGLDNNVPPAASTVDGSLKDAPNYGGSDWVFVEDCTLWQDASGDASVETYVGGKIVVRHCTMTNFYLGVHGNDSSVRSGHAIEVYENDNTVDMGSDYFAFVLSRGGTGLVWNNTITATGGDQGNKIGLSSFRSAGTLDPDYTLRFGYTGGQLDGSNPVDGNTAVADGSGTHTGSNNSATLTDSAQSWGADWYLGYGDAATNNTLQTYFVWNRTDGSGGFATANTSTTLTVALAGGTDNDFDTGDVYVVTAGYPGLDQNGWAGPTVFNGTYSTQTLTPWYQWGNTWNAVAGLSFELGYMTADYTDLNQPDSGVMIQEDREYYNDTQMPGYTPYTYPHPLRGVTATATATSATAGSITIE